MGVLWPGGRASDSKSIGPGFDLQSGLGVVSLIKTQLTPHSPEYWLIPKKQWLRPDMTEKLLNGMLNLSTNKILTFVSSLQGVVVEPLTL